MFEVSENALRSLRRYAERDQMSPMGDICRYAADKLEEAKVQNAKLSDFINELRAVCEDPMNRGTHTSRQMVKFLDGLRSKALGVLDSSSEAKANSGNISLGILFGIRVIVSTFAPSDMIIVSPATWARMRGWLEASMAIVKEDKGEDQT